MNPAMRTLIHPSIRRDRMRGKRGVVMSSMVAMESMEILYANASEMIKTEMTNAMECSFGCEFTVGFMVCEVNEYIYI